MNQSNLVQDILSIRNLIQDNTIGILLGERMNLDTAGAALGLYLALSEAGKNPQIISQKEPVVEIANLVGIDKIKKSFSGNSNKVVVSLPYNKGEIGKVSYKEENDRINFYLTASNGMSITPYETNDIKLIWDGSTPSVIITIGVNGARQLADYLVKSENSVKIINIDNSNDSFGDISIASNNFSSVSEVVAKIIKELRLPINIDIAQNLLDGILFGTRNFTKPTTSPYAFEMSGVLMQLGAVRADNRNTGKGMFGQQNRKVAHDSQSRNQSQNRPDNQSFSNVNNQNVPLNKNRNIREETTGAPQIPTENLVNDNQEVENAPFQAQSNQDVPSDWLMPKVFKGSQNIDDLK
jgi:nanoRNase/pAp phosphatase (c-di-AMP/oligoRNAs hydrolase)